MSSWTHVIGWTLIHFLWQGAMLAAVAAGALRLSRHRSANARYVTGCSMLAAMLALPVITAATLMTREAAPEAVARVTRAFPPAGTAGSMSGSWVPDAAFSAPNLWATVDALLPLVVFAWLAGVAVLLVRMTGGLWNVRRLQVAALGAGVSRWQASVERIAARLDLGAAVHVVESALVDTPGTVGWLRPVILLPIAALANLTPSQIEALLAHELVHIRRHDYLVNLVQTVAETLLFFHPAVWWISSQIRTEREHCCDDVVVQMCGDPVDYAAALAELEAWRSTGTTLALAADGGSLAARIRRLLKVPAIRERSASWVVTVGLTLLVAVTTGGMYVSSYGESTGVPGASTEEAQDLEPIASPDTFGWQVHRTSHFDIYYYAALAPRLDQLADAAERAYQRISSELQYDLSFRVPLIPFATRSDFAKQGMVPEVRELIAKGDVTSFSEPRRNRVVILAEDEPERLYRLITHELTHIFAFDIIPRAATNAHRVPLWIDEGFAEYMRGSWEPAALEQIGNLVAARTVPKVASLPVTVANDAPDAYLGHTVFEFIEAEYGKAAVWQFLLAVRRYVVDDTGNTYQTAFNRTPDEFDAAFAEYLRRRFSP